MNISTGGPHILLFERDQQLATLLISELQLAGYTVHTARTAVEVFDAIARHAVRLVLVNLAQAAAARREFWVALDTQRRDRKVQVMTFLCTNIAGYGARDLEDRPQNTMADLEMDGMLGLMSLVDAVRTRVPSGNIEATTNTLPRLAKVGNPAFNPTGPLSMSHATQPISSSLNYEPAYRTPLSSDTGVNPVVPKAGSFAQTQASPLPTSQQAYATAPFPSPSPSTGLPGPDQPSYSEKIRAVLYPGQQQRTGWNNQAPANYTNSLPETREAPQATVTPTQVPNQTFAQQANNSPSDSMLQRMANGHFGGDGQSQESGLAQLSRMAQGFRAAPTEEERPTYVPPTPAFQTHTPVYQQQAPVLQPQTAPFQQQAPVASFQQPQPLQPQVSPFQQPQPLQPQVSPFQQQPPVQPQTAPFQQQAPVFQSAPVQSTAPLQASQPMPVIQSGPIQAQVRDVPVQTSNSQPLTMRETTRPAPAIQAEQPQDGTIKAYVPPTPRPLSVEEQPSLASQPLRASPILDMPIERTITHSPTTDQAKRPDVLSRTNYGQQQAPSVQTGPATTGNTQAQPPVTPLASINTPMPSATGGKSSSTNTLQQEVARIAEELKAAKERKEARDREAANQPTPSQPVETEETATDKQREAVEEGMSANNAVLLDIVQSLPPISELPPPAANNTLQAQILNGRATRSLNKVLLDGHLVPQDRLEVAQNIQRMLRGVDLNYQLGEILLMFKLLTPDQLLAASLVSYGMITTTQISSLGRIRQELHAMGLEYDLENLLVLFRMLTPEQLREVRSTTQN